MEPTLFLILTYLYVCTFLSAYYFQVGLYEWQGKPKPLPATLLNGMGGLAGGLGGVFGSIFRDKSDTLYN